MIIRDYCGLPEIVPFKSTFMIKLKLSIMVILVLLCFSSCYRMLFSHMGVLEKSVTIEKIANVKKEVIFIPMHHIGKREFYADVKNLADSLKNTGFVFYYESLRVSSEKDSLTDDNLRRKMRYIIGSDIFSIKLNGGYIDTVNNTVLHKKLKIIEKEDLVNQPPYILLGIDTASAKWADVYLSEMIPAYEQKFGNIVLSECDFKTPFNAKYSCFKNKDKKAKSFALADYRNQKIAKMITNDPRNKIAIIYGAKHYEGLLKALQQNDSTWKTN